jgi:hypothetical protein
LPYMPCSRVINIFFNWIFLAPCAPSSLAFKALSLSLREGYQSNSTT